MAKISVMKRPIMSITVHARILETLKLMSDEEQIPLSRVAERALEAGLKALGATIAPVAHKKGEANASK